MGIFIGNAENEAAKIKKIFLGGENEILKVKRVFIGGADGYAKMIWQRCCGCDYVPDVGDNTFTISQCSGCAQEYCPSCEDGSHDIRCTGMDYLGNGYSCSNYLCTENLSPDDQDYGQAHFCSDCGGWICGHCAGTNGYSHEKKCTGLYCEYCGEWGHDSSYCPFYVCSMCGKYVSDGVNICGGCGISYCTECNDSFYHGAQCSCACGCNNFKCTDSNEGSTCSYCGDWFCFQCDNTHLMDYDYYHGDNVCNIDGTCPDCGDTQFRYRGSYEYDGHYVTCRQCGYTTFDSHRYNNLGACMTCGYQDTATERCSICGETWHTETFCGLCNSYYCENNGWGEHELGTGECHYNSSNYDWCQNGHYGMKYAPIGSGSHHYWCEYPGCSGVDGDEHCSGDTYCIYCGGRL
jgi:hypothetical protein